jgi:GNAT superfamily N-acetyltransferase
VWRCAWSVELSQNNVRLRGLQPGDLGWVISRHGSLYAAEYGLDLSFEVTVAGIVAEVMRSFDPASDAAWIAEHNGGPVGSVFVVRDDDVTAKLRLLIVDPAARGLGLGRLLTDAAIGFARDAGYRRITLWTLQMLDAARHIYRSAGFERTDEAQGYSFGRTLVNETWVLELKSKK